MIRSACMQASRQKNGHAHLVQWSITPEIQHNETSQQQQQQQQQQSFGVRCRPVNAIVAGSRLATHVAVRCDGRRVAVGDVDGRCVCC